MGSVKSGFYLTFTLKIHFGDLAEQIKHPDDYFDLICQNDWFNDSFVREICLGVDKVVAHSHYQMEHPVFGPINSTMLSTSCKNTTLAYKTDRIIPATHIGDNCAPYVYQIAQQKNLTITLNYLMDFSECVPFVAFILNSNKMVHDYFDYLCEAGDYLEQEDMP